MFTSDFPFRILGKAKGGSIVGKMLNDLFSDQKMLSYVNFQMLSKQNTELIYNKNWGLDQFKNFRDVEEILLNLTRLKHEINYI